MWHDYGYIEDDKGKIYDFKLLKRMFTYTRPYMALIVLACLLILATTGADLVIPYLTKMAIDRHIEPYARELAIGPDTSPDLLALVEKNRALLISSGTEGIYFLSAENSRRMDAADLTDLKRSGLLKPEAYHLFANQAGPALDLADKHPEYFLIHPKVLAISTNDLAGLDSGEIMSVRTSDISGLGRLALVACLVILLGYVFNFSEVLLLEYIGQKVTHDLRQSLLAHVLNQSMVFHDRMNTGRLVARLTNDIQNLNEMIKSVAVTFFKDAFILVGIVVILLYINWRLALLTFTLLPPIFIVTMLFRRQARQVFRDLRGKISQINSNIGEAISGIRVIQAFCREDVTRSRFDQLNHRNYLAGIRQVKVFAIFMPLIDILASLALGLIIWYGGLNVMAQTMTLGAVVAFIAYVRQFFQPIRELAEKFNLLQSAMASMERIFTLMDQQTALPAPAGAPEPVVVNDLVSASIEFDRVSFNYENGNPVLSDLSFKIEPGSTLAIVGATGAGKTSIINLLLRFYDVTSGRILIDGADIRSLDPAQHRNRIGLVMQDVFLFAGTVWENIAFSRGGLSLDKVKAAARVVGADRFIESLPQGYDQALGEGGLSLSVGQRQLLSFARALVRDPQILILDEATAFIDSETEKLIESALEKLISDRTSIIIAHRLSTIRRADRILVLHQGRAWESGTHAELMAQKGLYYRLHQLQFTVNQPSRSGAENIRVSTTGVRK